MRSVLAAVVALQALVASAMPGNLLEQRQNGRCNADNCLRALRNPTNSAKATSDCRAYFGEKIVTPCPSTSTVGTTTSITFIPSTITVVTDTVTTTAVTTSTSVSTVLTTSTVNLGKRELIPRCPQSQTRSSQVPVYASTCGSGTRFPSACSCIGVSTGTTTTLLPVTVYEASTTVTSTNTVIITNYIGSTISVTSTVVITSTSTSTVSITSSSSSSSTSSSTTSSTSTTSSPAPPSCPTFAITYEGTNPAGTGKNFNRDFTTGTVTLGNASPLWYLQANGKLTPLENKGQGIVLSQFESSGQPFDRMNVDSDPQPKNLQCSVVDGILDCEGSNGTESDASDEFYICPDYTASQFYASGPGTLYISDGTNLPDGCTRIFLTATPQC